MYNATYNNSLSYPVYLDRVAVAEALLSSAKVELADTIKDRDQQMAAMARLIASQQSEVINCCVI